LAWSQQNIHSYYKKELQYNPELDESYSNTIQIDSDTYANVSPSSTTYTLQNGKNIRVDVTKSTKTYYEYEIDENEKKRQIKLLKPEFIQTVEEEFKNIFE
jgi:hypothetical protein